MARGPYTYACYWKPGDIEWLVRYPKGAVLQDIVPVLAPVASSGGLFMESKPVAQLSIMLIFDAPDLGAEVMMRTMTALPQGMELPPQASDQPCVGAFLNPMLGRGCCAYMSPETAATPVSALVL
jgi:hypothetical protein